MVDAAQLAQLREAAAKVVTARRLLDHALQEQASALASRPLLGQAAFGQALEARGLLPSPRSDDPHWQSLLQDTKTRGEAEMAKVHDYYVNQQHQQPASTLSPSPSAPAGAPAPADQREEHVGHVGHVGRARQLLDFILPEIDPTTLAAATPVDDISTLGLYTTFDLGSSKLTPTHQLQQEAALGMTVAT